MVKKVTSCAIIGLYCNNYSKRYYLRELADLLGKPHQTIKPYVEKLVKAKVLNKYERHNITDYGINFKNKKVCIYLVIAESEKLLKQMQEDKYLDILYDKLYPYFKKNTFIVFGSAVNRIQKASDIDLLVIGRQNVTKATKEFEAVYDKKIHKIQVTDINKVTIRLTKEIYRKHIILNNAETIIRHMGELNEKNLLV